MHVIPRSAQSEQRPNRGLRGDNWVKFSMACIAAIQAHSTASAASTLARALNVPLNRGVF